MPLRRFVLSAVYLAALAAALALADLGAAATIGLMLAGWVLVAGFEWIAWRSVPHFGAGLPPRWQAATIALPPPRPLEQMVAGYPDAHRDEGATWIASAELLGTWPVAAPLEDTQPEPDQL